MQSSLWEMLHRNYMCAYFARLAFEEDGVCKLCHVIQDSRTHIFLSCDMINRLYNFFSPLLHRIVPCNLTEKEKIMGLELPAQDNKKEILRNYITFTIRHVAYRNRNKNYGNLENIREVLASSIVKYIKRDITFRWRLARHQLKMTAFSELYLLNNIIAFLDDRDMLIFQDFV